MGRSISSNTNPKVPITFLYTAHMMGGYSFCHAYVYCHGKKPEEVWGFIEAAYLEKTKEEKDIDDSASAMQAFFMSQMAGGEQP